MRVIILLRHGEARHHIDDLTGGWTDTALTPAGRAQIGEVAEELEKLCRGKRPLVFSSDLLRARQSAGIITGRLAAKVELKEFLREKNNGLAAGKTLAEAKKLRLPAKANDPDSKNYPGGETRREFFRRVADGLAQLPVDEECVIIVAHKGTIQNILFWWLGLSIDSVCDLAVSFKVCSGSVSVLNINKWGEREISLLNYRRGGFA